jgi:hypothetical protein
VEKEERVYIHVTCICRSKHHTDTKNCYLFGGRKRVALWKRNWVGGRLLYILLILEVYEHSCLLKGQKKKKKKKKKERGDPPQLLT